MLEELEEQGDGLPIPNSFSQNLENQKFNYVFPGTNVDPSAPLPEGRWSQGASLDDKGQFSARNAIPMGQEPVLAPPRPNGFAQTQQMQDGQSLIGKVVNALK